MKVIRSVALVAVLTLLPAGWASAGQTPPPAAPPKPAAQTPPAPAQVPVVRETVVVVSASRVEQELVNAPATMTVIDPSAIVVSSATNYADILRSVPGLNITQISARDVNVTSRASTSSLATTELTLLDGRSLYQDFFGFTMWDFMPVNVNDIKRIEVVRGPASAVWGANAMNGVINVITKTPRENPGTTVTAGVGSFPRDVFGHPAKAGWLYYLNGAHAAVLNDRWSYRVSGGGLRQDPFPRPTGVIPGSPTFQPYPAYSNEGTQQPKVDARFDYDFPDKVRTMSFSGGSAGTSGIMHSGIGPFSIDSGSTMSYGKFNFTKNALHVQAFLNVLNGDAANLLSVGPTGSPILFGFTTKTVDVEAGNSLVTGTKNVLTYGGNVRFNRFALTIAPGEDHRNEGGGYVQNEYIANTYVRLVAGARVDKFSSIDNAVFSPRVALLMRPHEDHTFRVSYNRAFRAPSMINNNLQVTIANPLPLAAFGQPGVFLVPTDAVGNPALKEEHVDAYEVSYTGIVNKRTTVSVAGYFSRLDNEILFTQPEGGGLWPTSTPPPGWPLPGAFWAAAQTSAQFPKTFTYRNLGIEENHGLEIGVDSVLTGGASVYMNYSFQAQPVISFPLVEANRPSKHRFNAGVRYADDLWIAGLSVSSATSAFWQDVLDVRFSGTTPAYGMANASLGVKFGPSRHYQAIVRATNLLNQEVQQHIFGDVIKRQIVAEVRVQIK